MRQPNEVIAWRGIYRERIWHAMPVVVVKDTLQEIVLGIIPGAECIVEEHYARGIKNGKRRWDFTDSDWRLVQFNWHTNRVLSLVEPGKYYSIMHFWNHTTNEFLGYYINFQQPVVRSHCGVDAMDLDLELDINPDLTFKWKDEDDYQKAIAHGLLTPEWIQGIEDAKLVDAGSQLGRPLRELLRLFRVVPDGSVREPRLQFVEFIDLCSLVKETSAIPGISPLPPEAPLLFP